MNRTKPVVVAALVAVALAARPLGAQTPAPDGAQLYARNCASCHGATGVPNPAMVRSLGAMPDFSDARVMGELADSMLTNVITSGKGRGMPAYRTRLAPEQVRAIVAHVRTLSRRPAQ